MMSGALLRETCCTTSTLAGNSTGSRDRMEPRAVGPPSDAATAMTSKLQWLAPGPHRQFCILRLEKQRRSVRYPTFHFKPSHVRTPSILGVDMSTPASRAPRSPGVDSAPAHHPNRILAALPAEEFERLHPHLTTVAVEINDPSFWEPNQPIESVYFPIDLVASVLAVTEDGTAVEVGTIGNEGLVGLPVFLGAPSSPSRSVTQIAGRAERMPAATFRTEAAHAGALRDLLQRYTLAFMTQVSQSTACNRAHRAGQRLARWILVLRDRIQKTEFPMTQEFLAQMLGVRRATVSEIAGELQAEGLISYRSGIITLTDEAALEGRACECYRIVRREFERLLGVSMG